MQVKQVSFNKFLKEETFNKFIDISFFERALPLNEPKQSVKCFHTQ